MTKSRGINRPAHRWTEAEQAMLRELYPDMKTEELAAQLGVRLQQVYSMAKRMGLEKSAVFQASALSGRMVRGANLGEATQFKPGHVPWSMYQKGIRMSPATEFKPGSKPPNCQEVGALRINSMGDIDIKVGEGKGQWVSLRRYVWEQAYGPIPEGMCIVPLDYDGHNTQIENLKMVDRAGNVEHNLLGRYPKELRNVMALGGRLRNQINKRQEAAHA